MNPQDLAAIVNGLPIYQQVEFLASLRLNNFLVADEITYKAPNEAQVLESLNNVSALILEYHLNFGTNRLVDGKLKDEADDINGIFFNGFFFSDDMKPFKAIDWTRVEVQHD